MRACGQQAHAAVECFDEGRAGERELTAEVGGGERHRHHELDLRGTELGLEPRARDRAQHELDLVGRLERDRIDEDQLLLEPEREQVAPGEALLVGGRKRLPRRAFPQGDVLDQTRDVRHA